MPINSNEEMKQFHFSISKGCRRSFVNIVVRFKCLATGTESEHEELVLKPGKLATIETIEEFTDLVKEKFELWRKVARIVDYTSQEYMTSRDLIAAKHGQTVVNHWHLVPVELDDSNDKQQVTDIHLIGYDEKGDEYWCPL